MRKVLILGAGLVAKPMVKYLLEKGINVIVASRTLSKAENLVQGHSKGKAIRWTVKEKNVLNKLVEDSDCVVSLLPYIYHVEVSEVCLLHKTDLVTTSYVSSEMQNLHEKAIDSGVLLLNEIGLDPGIDHMSAKKTIDYIHRNGGNVIAFHSYCGALPAPEYSNNPFRYKIGWSPRGIALAGRNRGRYLLAGEEVTVPEEELFKHFFKMNVEDIGTMEIYPNRDSIQYISKYDINETNEIFRGTIRYPGWCELWYTISKLGLLNTEEKDLSNLTYLEFVKNLIRTEDEDFSKALASRLGYKPSVETLNKLEWLGLFQTNKITIEKGSNIDILVSLLNEKLIYKDGEKDMVILQDEIVSEINGENDIFISKLVDYGIVGDDTAIARTVSLPAACAVHLILEGEIKEKGVLIPVVPDIYEPVLKELLNVGIELKVKRERAGNKFGLDSKDFVTY